jgi:hypothetical protein
MAKTSGIGSIISVDDSSGTARDISGDVNSLTNDQGQDLAVVTGIDKSAQERIPLLADLTVTLNGTANFSSNMSHDVFKTLTGTRTVTWGPIGSTSGYPKLEAEMVVESFNYARDASGALNYTASLSLQSGTVPAWTTY